MKTFIISIALTAVVVAQDAPPESTTTVSPQQPKLMLGQVTGDKVYIRSGDSTNFYAVTRLDRGQRIVVLDMSHGWAHIRPPKGCYSLVDRNFVDPDVDDTGVINGDRVWVHPGSELYAGPYYAKQTQLRRGQSVRIIGETEQYYKIVPPEGARLSISADYVEILAEGVDANALATGTDDSAQSMPPAPSSEDIEDTLSKAQIAAIEVDLEAEFEKDPMHRDLAKFVERFQALADGNDSNYATQRYARYRVEQLHKTIKRTQAIKQMQDLGTEVDSEREQFMKQRSTVRPPVMPIDQKFAARGKFTRSFAFENSTSPTRYRLVDPDRERSPTIAYVEIESDSGIDPEAYLGRYVGVRAKGQRLLQGTVDAVVVYIAAEIVILEQQGESGS